MATLPVNHPEFAANLRRLMADKFTTKDLMQATNSTFASASRWQSGQAYPRHATLMSISNLLGVTYEELTGKSEALFSSPTRVTNDKKARSSFEVVARRLDTINHTIDSLKRERDSLKLQMQTFLDEIDSET